MDWLTPGTTPPPPARSGCACSTREGSWGGAAASSLEAVRSTSPSSDSEARPRCQEEDCLRGLTVRWR
jgi:hypothetical protein